MGEKHALVISVCLQAHFLGIYRLAVNLVKRGVTITFVGLAREIALLKTFEELQGLDFNLVSYQDYGSETFVSVGDALLDILEFLPKSKSHFQPIFDKLLADKKAGLPGPTCLIGDRFLIWAVDAAKELNIPYYQFFSCGAIYPRVLQAQVPLVADGTLTVKEGPGGSPYLEPFEGYVNISGLPPLAYRDVIQPPPMDFKQVSVVNDLGIGANVNKADGVIVNTFYELEAPVIDALQQSWRDDSSLAKMPKLFPVGPISNAATFKDRSLVSLKRSGADSLQWLDRQPPRSVVFICVGSIARLFPPQIKELTQALEASEQSFLWVVSRGVADLIPPDFEARTREKGLVVSGWVPQLQILQHSAIGGFVTHCGWNSIIESITSGVPMAAWPQMTNDQFVNCRHLVDVLKVAVEVRSEDTFSGAAAVEDGTMPTSASPKNHVGLERAVRLLLSKEGNALRARVEELKKKAEAAVAEGGASQRTLNDLVESIPS